MWYARRKMADYSAHPNRRLHSNACALISAIGIATSLLAGPVGFQIIPLPAGTSNGYATALSADGRVLVGLANNGSQYLAFRWTNETGSILLPPLVPGQITAVQAVSADGSVVVGWSGDRAVRWDDGIPSLIPLSLGANPPQRAYGVSADGRVFAGHESRGGHVVATRVSLDDGVRPLSPIPTFNDSFASAISADGRVVVGASGNRAVRWNDPAGTPVTIGMVSSGANAVSASGDVIVGFSNSLDNSRGPFAWVFPNRPIAGEGSRALSVSADGRVVGGMDSTLTPGSAFVWSEIDGQQHLGRLLSAYGFDTSGLSFNTVTSVSADGSSIAGALVVLDPIFPREMPFMATLPRPGTPLPRLYRSGTLSPIGSGHPAQFGLPGGLRAASDVHIHITARADLGAAVESIEVRANGVAVATAFQSSGHDCPSEPDAENLVIPASLFNAAVTPGSSTIIDLIATSAVDPFLCPVSFISADVAFVAQYQDCDADGLADTEEIARGLVCDRNGNEIPDPCETVNPCPADIDRSCVVDADDLADFINCYFAAPSCDQSDFNADGDTNPDDLGDFINAFFGGC